MTIRHKLAGLLIFGLTLGFEPVVHAGPFEDGLAAYQHGDHATAKRLWQPLADQGVASAQFNLGTIYSKGEGVTESKGSA